MATNTVDLAKLFGAVANNLTAQKDALNQEDTYNHDHGDNMVQTFSTIAKVVADLKGKDQATQLASASKELRKSKSGSAKLYAEGLNQASQQFKGQSITPDSAGLLLQALMGAQNQPAPTSQPKPQGGGLLASLLGAFTGSKPSSPPVQNQSQADDGLDIGDLLNAGMAFMDSKQKGGSTAEAAISALLSASPLGQSTHRTQSGSVVASTIMQVLGGLANK
ncbi:hypothetical protein ACFLXB_09545 [Chloroflexota bacterium]